MRKLSIIFLIILVFTAITAFRAGCSSLNLSVNDPMEYMDYGPKNRDTSVNKVVGISVGDNGKIYKSDGLPPAPWDPVPAPSRGANQNLHFIKFFTGNVISGVDTLHSVPYIAGSGGTVLRSTNDGANWQDISMPSGTNLYGLDFLYNLAQFPDVVAVGDSGKVFRSNSSGSSWSPLTVGMNRKLNSIICINDGIWVAVGAQGSIFRTTNSGSVWTLQTSNTTQDLNSIVTVRYDTYLIVGNGGKILVSTNYGLSWGGQTSNTTANLHDVYFKNQNEGITGGDGGVVRHTTNGGISWQSDSYFNSLTTRNILSICKADSTIGNSVTRASTSDDPESDVCVFIAVSSNPINAIGPVSGEVPESFSLKQNYPNPFNPATIIEFSMPEKSAVNITIFDITGKAVSVVIDQELTAGNYKLDWNAENIPSGVYFCRLSTEGFTETRKMVLLK